MNQLFKELVDESGPYWFEGLDEGTEKELLNKAQKESFIAVFKDCVERRPLHLGLARHLLRRGRRSRTNVLNSLIFEHIEALAPVLRDTVRYLAVTLPKAQAAKRGKQILAFCKDSDIGALPFVRMWILELLHRRPDLCSAADAIALAEESTADLGYRPAALLAAVYKQVDWVRARKETWRNYEPWGRRALIWSTSILPSGERKPFLCMVAEQGDLLDAAIAKLLLSKK
jgi:hypothetical protein